jgi:LmbE family N-acetylglucosaminyl deacetylase
MPAPNGHVTTSATPATGSVRGRCVVFLHAHPDDEAIFTAATMHRLARQGARVVLVTATAGELGPALRPLPAGRTLAEVRRDELERACAALGVARLVLLGRRDSGMPGWADNAHPDALAAADVADLARRLADLCAAEGAEALVHYDRGGIYGHPDHVAVHRLGTAAARLAGIADYQATVDRSRVRTDLHLVGPAHAGVTQAYARPELALAAMPELVPVAQFGGPAPAGPFPPAGADPAAWAGPGSGAGVDLAALGRPGSGAGVDLAALGRPGSGAGADPVAWGGPFPSAGVDSAALGRPGSAGGGGSGGGAGGVARAAGRELVPLGADRADVTTVVTASPADLAAKRAAMAAHASQIDVAVLRHRRFAGTYGREWYVRSGRPGLLDLPGIAS